MHLLVITRLATSTCNDRTSLRIAQITGAVGLDVRALKLTGLLTLIFTIAPCVTHTLVLAIISKVFKIIVIIIDLIIGLIIRFLDLTIGTALVQILRADV